MCVCKTVNICKLPICENITISEKNYCCRSHQRKHAGSLGGQKSKNTKKSTYNRTSTAVVTPKQCRLPNCDNLSIPYIAVCIMQKSTQV